MQLKIIIAAVVLLLAGAAVFFFTRPQQSAAPGVSATSNPFGETAVPGNTAPGQTTPGSVSVKTDSGNLQTKDFAKGSGVIADATTSVLYVSFPPTGNPSYEINYLPDHSFFIGIFKEPIGETRRAMTDDLSARLGVSGSELCSVSAYISVPAWVNQTYRGINLGFPGCPGATTLPGD